MKSFFLFFLPITFFCLIAIQPCPTLIAAESFEEEFAREIEFEPGGSFSLDNVCGRIEVSGWDQNKVQIQAVKKVSKVSSQKKAQKWLDRIEIRIDQEGSSIKIETKFPKKFSPNLRDSEFERHWFLKTLSWLSDFSCRKSQLEVNYKVMLPRVTDVNLDNNLGKIEVRDLEGDITAKVDLGEIRMYELTGNLKAQADLGSITMEGINGSVTANTDLGSISMDLEKLDPDQNIKLSSELGSISLGLPQTIAADLDLSTELGSIKLDFPVTVQGEISKHRVKGKINGGGPLIKISTELGRVKIKEL
ncbi:MAG TPA: DUF4097 family beta strand repeat-containing protein [archaeon]|nr:DUF4097 family beta strand repeat-containing protein [archaeon]